MLATGNPGLPMPLSITATDGGRRLMTIATTVTLDETDEAGACGTVSHWQKSAELTPTGELRLK